MDPIELERLTAAVLQRFLDDEEGEYSLKRLRETVHLMQKELAIAHHHSLTYISGFLRQYKNTSPKEYRWPERELTTADYVRVLEGAIQSQLDQGVNLTHQDILLLKLLAQERYDSKS
ncbi:MAG: hypothetical protein OXQ32_02315 [bacterium]|nr:hypothetical protein [bacterium]